MLVIRPGHQTGKSETMHKAAASAQPRDPCQDYANRVGAAYDEYRWWTEAAQVEAAAYDYEASQADNAVAADYYVDYQRYLNAAWDYGCF